LGFKAGSLRQQVALDGRKKVAQAFQVTAILLELDVPFRIVRSRRDWFCAQSLTDS
jgi:hypothetical protein